jgi:hypothetical protein
MEHIRGYSDLERILMKQNAQLMAMIRVDSVEEARAFYVDGLGFHHMMGMLGKEFVRCRWTVLA